MLDWISKEFLIAICVSLAIALVSILLAPPYQPRQSQQIENEQQTERGLESQQNGSDLKSPMEPRRDNDAQNRNDDASEYWTILGRRLKITTRSLLSSPVPSGGPLIISFWVRNGLRNANCGLTSAWNLAA
jgi:hypothetical protein